MARTEPQIRHRAKSAPSAESQSEPATIELPVGQSAYGIEELRQRITERLARRPPAPRTKHG
jgi:hypothetical protein